MKIPAQDLWGWPSLKDFPGAGAPQWQVVTSAGEDMWEGMGAMRDSLCSWPIPLVVLQPVLRDQLPGVAARDFP